MLLDELEHFSIRSGSNGIVNLFNVEHSELGVVFRVDLGNDTLVFFSGKTNSDFKVELYNHVAKKTIIQRRFNSAEATIKDALTILTNSILSD